MASEQSSTPVVGSNPYQKRLWSPVLMQRADGFWILLILSLSVTVILTRMYLELSGYPQVGDSTFHIAHLLWGGLVMFIALVLPLSIANPYTPWISAVLGGIGAGLFIDEVGKFITQSNDYFYPLAFPIIYAFVVVCFWLFFRIRARQPRDARTLLYHALEDLKQVLDNDLDPFEHKELTGELARVSATTMDPEERALAEALLGFIRNRNIQLAKNPLIVERFWARTRSRAAQSPSRIIMRWILILGFAWLALSALLSLGTFVALASQGGQQAVETALGNAVIVSGKSQYIVNNPILSGMQTLFFVLSGLLALVAAVLLLIGRERIGLRLGTAALVISLLIVNLLSFYFNQLYAILGTLGQAALLGIALLYRWRFLQNPDGMSAGSTTT